MTSTTKNVRKIKRWLRSESGQTWTHRAPGLIVAAVALYVSYWHIRHVCLVNGYDLVSASLTPLSVDGLVIVSARYISKAKTALGKGCALFGFLLGVAATLAGNLLSAQPTTIGYGVATWPAIAVVATGAILHWGDAKKKPAKRTTTRKPAIA